MIHLLGPVELTSRERQPRLGSDKSRLVLASLAVEVGRPVSLDALVHRLWEDEPPASPRENLHSYVSRIRRALRAAHPAPRTAITQHAHTYTLEADPDSVDWHRYRRLVAWAEEVSRSGDEARAVAQIHDAERLWQGAGLSGLPGTWAESVRLTMDERRRGVTASRVAMELRMGRYARLAGELAPLAEQHPADETLVGQFMTACYGSGRQADALRVFERTRRVLREELGTDVGDELARIHHHILRRSPVALLVRPGERATARRTGTPDNLPRHVPLVGRHSEMRRLRSAMTADDPGSTAVVVESISGMAGIGKTCLAVHAAHELGDHYPDGRLYLDLRAHHPPQRPLSTEAALTSLLRLLGVPADEIPADAGARAALWRRQLAHRKALVILDDALSPDQVRPLLPDAPPSLALVTSRSRLTGLSTARSLALDVLPRLDAIALFRKFAYGDRGRTEPDRERPPGEGPAPDEVPAPGGGPVRDEVPARGEGPVRDEVPARGEGPAPDEVPARGGGPAPDEVLAPGEGPVRDEEAEEIGRIVHMCGYLPLAIELAASRLTAHPSWTPRALRERLSRGPGRLVELRDGYREIADAFAMSYQGLTPAQQSAFRKLSIHPGTEFGPHAAAILLGCGLDEAERLLEALLAWHLIQEPVPHRYRFHDLLGEYARTLCAAEESEQERNAALGSLLDFYVHLAGRCDLLLFPSRRRPGAGEAPPSGTTPPQIGTPDEARGWLTTELSNLLTAEHHARGHGLPDRAAALALAIGGFLDAEARWAEAVPAHTHAVAHLEQTPDTAALRRALLDLGSALSSTARYSTANEIGHRALTLARESSDTFAEVEARRMLGVLAWRRGENRTALGFHTHALELSAELNDPLTEASCRNNIAISLLHLGEHEGAQRQFRRALEGFRAAGDERNFGKTLNNLGDLQLTTGNPEAAQRAYEEALTIAEKRGSRSDIAITQANIARILIRAGSLDEGMERYRLALGMFRAVCDRKNEAATLCGLGQGHLASEDFDSAAECARQSLAIAREIGAVEETGQSHFLAGQVALARDRQDLATEHLSTALSLAQHAGAREGAARAEAALAVVGRRGDETVHVAPSEPTRSDH